MRTIRVRYGTRVYDRDLALCRRALLDRAIKDGLNSVHRFAASIEVSTTTVSGFLSGQVPGSEELARRILAGLRLTWEEIHSEVTAEG
jgi:hypothetical protein